MATTDRETDIQRGDDLASRIRSADMVAMSTSESAEAIAATGLLVGALQAIEHPFHVRVGRLPTVTYVDRLTTVSVGEADPTADIVFPAPVIDDVCGLVHDLDQTPDSTLTAVSRISWGVPHTLSDQRTPGIGLVEELPDGLAHSTLVHGPWSSEANEITHEQNDRDLASEVVLETLAASPCQRRTGEALKQAVNPVPLEEGPFSTIEGYADILGVLTDVDPGLALALVCGQLDRREEALSTWRSAAQAIHKAIQDGPATQHDEIAVYRDVEAAPAMLARLAQQFSVNAETVIAIADGSVGVAGSPATIETVSTIDAIESPVRQRPTLLSGAVSGSPDAIETAVTEVAV